MATTDILSPSTPTITQPIQVGHLSASFAVDQEQTFEVWLASHVKPDDLLILISNPVIGQIDHQIEWLHCSVNKESTTTHGNKNNNNTQQTSEPSKCRVSFLAQIVGLYTINVEITQPQKFCVQFQAKAYDLRKVFIQNSSGKCRLNESYEFGVDASEAGEGQLEIAVNEGEIPNQVQVLDNGKCIVNFVPEENIPHVVDIKFNGHNVNGCPFVVEIDQHSNGKSVDDVPKQRIANDVPTKLGKPTLQSEDRVLVNTRALFSLLNVQLSRTDIKDIIVVDPENQAINYKLTQEDQVGRLDLEFTPAVVGDYNVDIQPDSALLNKLPTSITEQFPFSIKVFDYNEVLVTDVIDGVVGHPIYFFIDATKAGSGNLEIKISSMTRNVPNYPSSEANAKIRVNFTPIEAVDHTIDVKFNGIPVPNNPFIVKVAQIPQARIPITSLDALKYTPIDETLRFNVEYIGSKSNLPLLTAESCEVHVLEPDFVYSKLSTIELLPAEKNNSNKQQTQCSFRVAFRPLKIGPHKLFVKVNNELVPSSPITSNVYNIKEVRVSFEKLSGTSSQNGISETSSKPIGKVNEPVTFTVDASRAGEGTLALAVVSSVSKNPVQTDVRVSERGHGLYNLTFIPTEFAPHSIDMSFNDRLVPLSPFIVDMINDKGKLASDVLSTGEKEQKAQVSRLTGASQTKPQTEKDLAADIGNLSLKSGEDPMSKELETAQKSSVVSREDELLRGIVVHGVSLKRTPVNSTGAFIIETNRMAQARDFDVLISDPSNNLVDVQCYLQQDGNLLTEWTPRRVGPHKIEVLYKDRSVPNSPFTTQAFDPSSVVLELPKTNEFKVNDKIEVKIDRKEAGEAELEAVMTNSSSEEQPLEIIPLEDGRIGELVAFKPSVGDKYKLSVTFSGYEVAKSPFLFVVHDNREPIKISGSGLKCAEVNRSAHFAVETFADGELKLRIECGDREIVPKIERKGKAYMIKYKPTEIGFAIISLYWNGSHINGSPFSVPVSDLSKIAFINPPTSSKAGSSESSNQIAVNYEPRVAREITVDTSKCGPGHLKAESYCRANPSLKFSIPVIQLTTDRYKLVFTCPPEHEQLCKGVSIRDISLEATYLLRFYYNNILVPEAHASVILSPHAPNKLKENHEAKTTNITSDISKTRNINNNNNGLSSKSKQTQPVEAQQSKPLLTSNTETTEAYSSLDCDPEKVICTADSLKGGVLGEEIKTFIDTRKAGPGELTALCTGPQKVAFCELLDRGDGTFILYIKPQESGRHFLTVKYADQHIPKSPFLIKVSGRPDPSKVRVYGPGVEHGVLSLYQSRFVCDTRGAGAGQLTVRIRGPKGAFRMETQRENQRDRTILCKYDPTEPGDYRIEIKWSGRQVPGSPYSVMIFDTQEELNRYLLSQQQRDRMHQNDSYRSSGKLSGDKLALPHQVPFQQISSDYGHYSHNPTLTTQTAAPKLHQTSSRLK